MAQYCIRRLDAPLPNLAGRAFDPDENGAWRALERADICLYPWDETGYRPEARAYVGLFGEDLHVLMCAKEQTVRAVETRCGGRVCEDSCLEFFLMPFPGRDARYLNVEVNAAGVAHIGLGEGRAPRKVWGELPEGFDVSASKHEGGWWAVRYALCGAFLREVFGAAPRPGNDALRGNFYTCDESIHPHFGVWNPIDVPKPDFHRPEYFGEMRMDQA